MFIVVLMVLHKFFIKLVKTIDQAERFCGFR